MSYLNVHHGSVKIGLKEKLCNFAEILSLLFNVYSTFWKTVT